MELNPTGVLPFCFLETRKRKAIENIHSSSRQASRKSKDHITFRCPTKTFCTTAWLKGLSVRFRGRCHSQEKAWPALSKSEIWAVSLLVQQVISQIASRKKTGSSQPPKEPLPPITPLSLTPHLVAYDPSHLSRDLTPTAPSSYATFLP